METIKRLANNRSAFSVATRARRKRFALFQTLLSNVPRPIRILDIGGDPEFWVLMGMADDPQVHITLMNLEPRAELTKQIRSIVADCRTMDVTECYDVVFSNSLIEHLGNWESQREIADKIHKLGRRYFVQTPNKYFPIEPHFLFPGFQFLPLSLRVWLASHFNLGWYKKMPTERASAEVRSIRLLSRREMAKLFPSAELYREKFALLTKSFVAYAGFES